jgi:hypothetical protein
VAKGEGRAEGLRRAVNVREGSGAEPSGDVMSDARRVSELAHGEPRINPSILLAGAVRRVKTSGEAFCLGVARGVGVPRQKPSPAELDPPGGTDLRRDDWRRRGVVRTG